MKEMIENRMVIDSEWEINKSLNEIKEKLMGPGYRESATGVFVPEEDAYDFAIQAIYQNEDLKKELVYWFYFNDWVKED